MTGGGIEMVFLWVAKLPCGCMVNAHVDEDGCEEDIGRWMREGLKVEKIFAVSVSIPESCEKCKDSDAGKKHGRAA